MKRAKNQERVQQRIEREHQDREKPQHMLSHDRPITGVTATADGAFIFTCSKDKTVICWSTEHSHLESVRTYAGHNGAVFSIALSSTPADLLTGGADGMVMLWRNPGPPRRGGPLVVTTPDLTVNNGGIVRIVRWCPFDDAPNCRRFAVGAEKLGQRPPTVGVWRVVDGKPSLESDWRVKANDLRWVGRMKLFTVHDDGCVVGWLVNRPGDAVSVSKVHAGPIAALSTGANDGMLLTASHDKTASVLDISGEGEPVVVTTFEADRPLNTVICTPDFCANESGAIIVAGGRHEREVALSQLLRDEFEVKVLDPRDGKPTGAGAGHFGPVHDLTFLPRTRMEPRGVFVSVSEDGTLRAHNTDGELVHSC